MPLGRTGWFFPFSRKLPPPPAYYASVLPFLRLSYKFNSYQQIKVAGFKFQVSSLTINLLET